MIGPYGLLVTEDGDTLTTEDASGLVVDGTVDITSSATVTQVLDLLAALDSAGLILNSV